MICCLFISVQFTFTYTTLPDRYVRGCQTIYRCHLLQPHAKHCLFLTIMSIIPEMEVIKFGDKVINVVQCYRAAEVRKATCFEA
jgi:hypothetical protein